MIVNKNITSVIITKGDRKLLYRAIESILNQTVKTETVIIYEFFTDIIAKAKLKYSKIHFIKSQTSSFPGKNWSQAVKISKSEYIAFLDDDDYWLPTYIDSCMRLANNNPDLIIHGMSSIKNLSISDDYLPPISFDIDLLLLMNIGVRTSNLCVSKKFYQLIGGHDDNAIGSTDRIFCIKASKLNPKIEYSKERLVIYQKDNPKISNDNNRKLAFINFSKNYGFSNDIFFRQYSLIRIKKFFGIDLSQTKINIENIWWIEYLNAEKNPEIREEIFCRIIDAYYMKLQSDGYSHNLMKDLKSLSKLHEKVIKLYPYIDRRKKIIFAIGIHTSISNIDEILKSIYDHIKSYKIPNRLIEVNFFMLNPNKEYQSHTIDKKYPFIVNLITLKILEKIIPDTFYFKNEKTEYSLNINRDRITYYLYSNYDNNSIYLIIDEDKRLKQTVFHKNNVKIIDIPPIVSSINKIQRSNPQLDIGIGKETGSPCIPLSSFIYNQLLDFSDEELPIYSLKQKCDDDDYYYDLGVGGTKSKYKIKNNKKFNINNFMAGVHQTRPMIYNKYSKLEQIKDRNVKGGITVYFTKKSLISLTPSIKINNFHHRRGDTLNILFLKSIFQRKVKEISFYLFHKRQSTNNNFIRFETQKSISDLYGYSIYKTIETIIEDPSKFDFTHLAFWLIDISIFKNVFNERKMHILNNLKDAQKLLNQSNIMKDYNSIIAKYLKYQILAIEQSYYHDFNFNNFYSKINYWITQVLPKTGIWLNSYVENIIDPWLIASILSQFDNQKILDWGCGKGKILSVLNQFGHNINGYDPNPAVIFAAKKLNNEIEQKINNNIPNIDPYDIIINSLVTCVIDNIQDLDEMLQQLSKYSREGTFLFFIVCHPELINHSNTGYYKINVIGKTSNFVKISKKSYNMDKDRIDIIRTKKYYRDKLLNYNWDTIEENDFLLNGDIPHFFMIKAKQVKDK